MGRGVRPTKKVQWEWKDSNKCKEVEEERMNWYSNCGVIVQDK